MHNVVVCSMYSYVYIITMYLQYTPVTVYTTVGTYNIRNISKENVIRFLPKLDECFACGSRITLCTWILRFYSCSTSSICCRVAIGIFSAIIFYSPTVHDGLPILFSPTNCVFFFFQFSIRFYFLRVATKHTQTRSTYLPHQPIVWRNAFRATVPIAVFQLLVFAMPICFPIPVKESNYLMQDRSSNRPTNRQLCGNIQLSM